MGGRWCWWKRKVRACARVCERERERGKEGGREGGRERVREERGDGESVLDPLFKMPIVPPGAACMVKHNFPGTFIKPSTASPLLEWTQASDHLVGRVSALGLRH